MNGSTVLENVRRYRAIASLYRQTAAFRPLQSRSLLGQAERWEQFAIAEMEAYFSARNRIRRFTPRPPSARAGMRWQPRPERLRQVPLEPIITRMFGAKA